MSPDKSIRERSDIDQSNNKERRYSRTSDTDSNRNISPTDSNANRKMPAFVSAPIPNSMNATRLVLNHYNNEKNSILAASFTLNDPLEEARALVERQHQQIDDVASKAALFRAQHIVAQQGHLAAQQGHLAAQQELKMALLEEARKEAIYHERLRRDQGLVARAAVEATIRFGESSKTHPLAEHILMAEREQILRRARQEENLIVLNNMRKEEILASERRKQDDDAILSAFLSNQNTMLSGASRLTPNGNLSRMAVYNKEALSFPFALQSSRSASSFRDSASSFTGRPNSSNNSPFNRSGHGSGMSQTNQGIPSLYNSYNTASVSAHTGRSNLNSVYASIPTTIATLPTTAHTGADRLRVSSLGTSATCSFASASSHQQETNSTGVDFLSENGDDIEQREDQKRFNKHQCKQWTVKYQELLIYQKKAGHCNVPHLFKENRRLAMWVKRQRHQHNLLVENKPSTLTGERIKLLESIGFVWNCLNSAWETNFEDLRIFAIYNGHFSVPPTYEKNPKLASWVITQRRQCKLLEDGKQSSMTEKRFKKLQQIGFPVWTKKAKKSPSIL